MVGFQLADVAPPSATAVKAVWGGVARPGLYPTAVAGMVSFWLAPPVVNADEVTLVVQDASDSEARWSVTVTVPSEPLTLAAPMVAVPRLALSGVLMLRAPPLTLNVVEVGPVPAWAAIGATATAPSAMTPARTGVTIALRMIPPVTSCSCVATATFCEQDTASASGQTSHDELDQGPGCFRRPSSACCGDDRPRRRRGG